MTEGNIIVECYADSLLIKQLNYDSHAFHSSVGEVANTMIKYFTNKVAVAVIDNDKKGTPSYFGTRCTQIKTRPGIILLKHNSADHYVVKISPAFEEFINAAAVECGVELFEKDLKKFKKITKDSKLHTNSKFVNYLNKLISKKPSRINALREFIAHAQANNFKTVRGKRTKRKK